MDAMTTNYMLGHVLLNSGIHPREWSVEELVVAFALLPKPKVSIEEFKASLGGDEPQEPRDMTTEEKIAHNTRQIEEAK